MTNRARPIYLDWNATTPPHPEVLAAVNAAWATAWANPASVHGPGRHARAHVEAARDAIAGLVGFDARDVVITSGGTEANNLALMHPFADGRGALVASRIEHPSVLRVVERLEASGVVVEWVAPPASGRIEVDAMSFAIERALGRAPLRLVTLQAVNHETGVVQDVSAVAELAHRAGALLHVDAVQAVGRLPTSSWAGADLVSVAAHKIRGPKGVGALATRAGLKVRPVLQGGAQERGIRPGTQDAAACAGFAVAAEHARSGPARYAAVAPLRDRLETALGALGAEVGAPPEPNGTAPRAPHVVNLSWPGWRGEELCAALDLEGVVVSSGAACSAGTSEVSPVLVAMVGATRAASAVRVSLGEETTAEDIDDALRRWAAVMLRARR